MTDETRTVSSDSTPHEPAQADLPSSIGPYEILGKLGEGGMGVVFEAQQQKPRRKVALKVVRGGQFVGDAQVKMFQREADTLARLKHPNIAAIYESGRTEGGQHFFAMELVRGKTLDEWGRSTHGTALDLNLRLALFCKIADAVNYAHQRGVIHRDLKPSNIVVLDDTRQGGGSLRGQSPAEIKILDFGLARITDTDVAAASMVTEVGMIKGTLPYMSPEQARGNPEAIDLRTDVYSLGVILYEMISGSRPYDTSTSSLVEAVRVICETPPKSLSQSVSGRRKLDPDIETIVGKALEKDADRRYASVAALSEDIDRYLTSRPILARPPSTAYQLRKFASRNKALVGGVAATFVVLVAGIVVSTVFGLREAQQRRAAVRAQTDLESVVEFQAGMLSATDPEAMGRRLMDDLFDRVADLHRATGSTEAQVVSSLSALDGLVGRVNATDLALGVVDEDILGRALAELDEKFGDQPLIDARLRRTIGVAYRNLGRYERGGPQLEAALETQRRILGDEHPDTLGSRHSLAQLYVSQGRSAAAEPLFLETLETRKRVLGDDHPETLESMSQLGYLYVRQGRSAEAEPLLLETLETRKRVLGDEHPETLNSRNELAILYENLSLYDRAEPLYLENLEIQRRVLGDGHLFTIHSVNNLALVYKKQGRYAEAEPLVLEALEGYKRVRGDHHRFTLNAVDNLADLYWSQGRHAEAESLHLETLEIGKRVLGDDHQSTLRSMSDLAHFYKGRRRYAEAEALFVQALETRRRALGHDHRDTLFSMVDLAGVYESQGRDAEAEPLVLETLETRRRVLGDDHPETLASMSRLADLYVRQSRHAEAEALKLETLEGRKRVLGDHHRDTLWSMSDLANLYDFQNRFQESRELRERQLALSKVALGPEHKWVGHLEIRLGSFMVQVGEYEDARLLLESGLTNHETNYGPDHENLIWPLRSLTSLFKRTREYERALPHCERHLQILEAQHDTEPWTLADKIEDCAKLRRKTGDEATADAMDERARSIREAG